MVQVGGERKRKIERKREKERERKKEKKREERVVREVVESVSLWDSTTSQLRSPSHWRFKFTLSLSFSLSLSLHSHHPTNYEKSLIDIIMKQFKILHPNEVNEIFKIFLIQIFRILLIE